MTRKWRIAVALGNMGVILVGFALLEADSPIAGPIIVGTFVVGVWLAVIKPTRWG